MDGGWGFNTPLTAQTYHVQRVINIPKIPIFPNPNVRVLKTEIYRITGALRSSNTSLWGANTYRSLCSDFDIEHIQEGAKNMYTWIHFGILLGGGGRPLPPAGKEIGI